MEIKSIQMQFKEITDAFQPVKETLLNQMRFQELVIDIFSSFAFSPSDFEEQTFFNVLKTLGEYVNADRTYICMYDFINQTCEIEHEWHSDDVEPLLEHSSTFSMDLIMDIVKTHLRGETFLVEDVESGAEGLISDYLSSQKIRSYCTIPMMYGNECRGYIGFDNIRDNHKYTENELMLMNSFSHALTNFLHRRNTEEIVKRSEARFQAIAEDSPAMICEYLPDMTITFVNQAFCDYYDMTQNEICGTSFLEYVPVETRDSVRNATSSLTPDHPIHTSTQSLMHKETLKWQQWRNRAFFDDAGKIVRFQGVGIDITEHKLQQERIENQQTIMNGLMNSIPDQVFFKNTDGKFMGCNKQFAQFLGLEKQDIIGRDDYELMDKGKADFYHHNDQAVIEHHQLGVHEDWITDQNGSKHFFETLKAPLKSEDGAIIGIVGVARDITERMQMRQKLQEAKNEAEEAYESKSTFLANMSHEIRTPLHSLMGMIELMKVAETGEDQQEYVSIAERSARNLLELTDMVLDYSKIESKQTQLNKEAFKIDELLYDLEITGKSLVTDKNLHFSVSKAEAVPDELVGDPTRLKQVLHNLISNAVKFTKDGSIEVEVTTQNEPDHNEQTVTLLWHVKDTGIGIPEDQIHEIFDNFKQVTDSSNHKYGGVGLGLAICRSIVTQMGGEIWAESQLGKGSRFSFTSVLEKAVSQEDHG